MKWIDSTVEIIRAAFLPEANEEHRRRGMLACHSLLALLQPQPVPVHLAPPPPVPEPQGPDVLDTLLERLQAFAPATAPAFAPRIIPSR